jgi:hypothetical protein
MNLLLCVTSINDRAEYLEILERGGFSVLAVSSLRAAERMLERNRNIIDGLIIDYGTLGPEPMKALISLHLLRPHLKIMLTCNDQKAIGPEIRNRVNILHTKAASHPLFITDACRLVGATNSSN